MNTPWMVFSGSIQVVGSVLPLSIVGHVVSVGQV